MTMRRISVDPRAFMREDYTFDHTENKAILVTTQDVEPVLEANRAEFNSKDKRTAWRGDFVKYASVPMVQLMELMKSKILSKGFKILDPKRLQRWFDEHPAFKTTPGRA